SYGRERAARRAGRRCSGPVRCRALVAGRGKRISRVLSPAEREVDHLSGTAVTGGLVQPTRDCRSCDRRRGPRLVPYSALLRVGFAVPSAVTRAAVVSYTPVSPLPVPEGHRRSALCCTFRRLATPGR